MIRLAEHVRSGGISVAKPVRDVTTEDVRAIIWRKKDEGFDAAAGNIRGVLKRLFDYSMTAGLVSVNPVLALPMRHVHKAKSRERALTPDEIRRFLTAAFESNIRRQLKMTPEDFKAWSQNLGHEGVLTTFYSYGAVAPRRQGEIIKELASPVGRRTNSADEIAAAVLKAVREGGLAMGAVDGFST